MRTNIEIDDKLMAEAMTLSGVRTKKAVVEAALDMFVKTKRQGGLRKLFGKVAWEGDLQESRTNRLTDDAWTR